MSSGALGKTLNKHLRIYTYPAFHRLVLVKHLFTKIPTATNYQCGTYFDHETV
jgi:S-ribosylhomocysteine lyase LuxS involved in autoinducer biosynthesis